MSDSKLAQLQDSRSIDALLDGAPLALLLKHSERCGISRSAMAEVRALADRHPGLPIGWFDVVHQRPLSTHLTERTGIEHASPQAFLVSGGTVHWHASHFDITAEKVEEALEAASRPTS